MLGPLVHHRPGSAVQHSFGVSSGRPANLCSSMSLFELLRCYRQKVYHRVSQPKRTAEANAPVASTQKAPRAPASLPRPAKCNSIQPRMNVIALGRMLHVEDTADAGSRDTRSAALNPLTSNHVCRLRVTQGCIPVLRLEARAWLSPMRQSNCWYTAGVSHCGDQWTRKPYLQSTHVPVPVPGPSDLQVRTATNRQPHQQHPQNQRRCLQR